MQLKPLVVPPLIGLVQRSASFSVDADFLRYAARYVSVCILGTFLYWKWSFYGRRCIEKSLCEVARQC